ncbi:TetR/AcrR family transcriptional regulator [Arthrobacter sp. ISL-28]|uniref:TetR/AcrR family transcriptional regulator n=1 Tax=Arthrobacter sp. ISL-28 TaxID=2819108 RepID=UPI001BE93037|nr:TetR/AcrR family transcriptional regulator [Arthrobacter sp. ISL-28]MBT2523354.1 TetR/AcrR family transcriptional regulator [Arthrobacter sp. ISL-28]
MVFYIITGGAARNGRMQGGGRAGAPDGSRGVKFSVSTWRDYQESVLPPLLQSAQECFVQHGYHGTTTRTLASRSGLSVAGLYHHYPSEQAILVAIMQRAMEDLYLRSQGALAEAGDRVEDQLRLHIECLVLFHAYRSDLAFIAASEIRSLEEEARAAHIAARDRQQIMLDGIVGRGVSEGFFSTEFPKETSRALVTMCTDVSQWYNNAGQLKPEALALRYIAIALSSLGLVRP